MPDQTELRAELEVVRKGRAAQEPQLRNRLGPVLRMLCGVDSTTPHNHARQALTTYLVGASDELPADLRLAVRAIVLLEGNRPEALEERTIVSAVDGLHRLGLAFALPRHPEESRPRLDIDLSILYGAEVDSVQRVGDNLFVQYLNLPRPLRLGERHTYARKIRIPDGQLMTPRYVQLVVRRCDVFELRVKFALDALPRLVWTVTKVPEIAYSSHQPGPDVVIPDQLGEVLVRFTALQPGFGYGLAWLPPIGGQG